MNEKKRKETMNKTEKRKNEIKMGIELTKIRKGMNEKCEERTIMTKNIKNKKKEKMRKVRQKIKRKRKNEKGKRKEKRRNIRKKET